MPLPTLDEIEAAYAVAKAIPVYRTWAQYLDVGGTVHRCACPMAALVAAKLNFYEAVDLNTLGDSQDDYYADEAEDVVSRHLHMTPRQVESFTHGFDGEPSDCDDEEAFQLGVAARRKFHPIDFADISM